MVFTDKQLTELRGRVKGYISDKRFAHTLGVERAAAALAEKIIPNRASEARAAALLHDLTKEYSDKEHLDLIRASGIRLTDSDLMSPSIFHSLSAPFVIKNDFPEFYTEDIGRAVFNHTTGDPEMSLFEEILFVADYVEDGRTYPACVQLRKQLFERLSVSRDPEESAAHLHDATIKALENTIVALVSRGSYLHEKTVTARNAFLSRRPMPLK